MVDGDATVGVGAGVAAAAGLDVVGVDVGFVVRPELRRRGCAMALTADCHHQNKNPRGSSIHKLHLSSAYKFVPDAKHLVRRRAQRTLSNIGCDNKPRVRFSADSSFRDGFERVDFGGHLVAAKSYDARKAQSVAALVTI